MHFYKSFGLLKCIDGRDADCQICSHLAILWPSNSIGGWRGFLVEALSRETTQNHQSRSNGQRIWGDQICRQPHQTRFSKKGFTVRQTGRAVRSVAMGKTPMKEISRVSRVPLWEFALARRCAKRLPHPAPRNRRHAEMSRAATIHREL